jgi:hypothetical protein
MVNGPLVFFICPEKTRGCIGKGDLAFARIIA